MSEPCRCKRCKQKELVRSLVEDRDTSIPPGEFKVLLEEVNPSLEEEYALREMARIRALVAKRKERT